MQLGQTLPSFALHATDGEIRKSDDFSGKAASVIIFTCNHCPYARAYVSRIARLVDKYENEPVLFYTISSNDVLLYPLDSFENMIDMGRLMHLHGKYLWDESQETAHAFGAQRTPEVFAFNGEQKLVYHGAIDNNWEHADQVTAHYLQDGIDAVLQNKQPAVQETNAIGCSIKWKPAV